MDSPQAYDGLLHLLKASSKEEILRCLSVCVSNLHTKNTAAELSGQLAFVVDLDKTELDELATSSQLLLRNIIYNDMSDPSEVKQLFSDDFNKKLRDLICKITHHELGKWKKEVIGNQVSMPKLTSYECAVSTNEASTFEPTTCVLSIKTTENPDVATKVLLDKETLATMIDSLAKIREQISSVVQ